MILGLWLAFVVSTSFSAEPVTKELHLVQGCRIFSDRGELIEVFPGGMCIFFADGSFVSATESSLRMFDKNNEVKWELPGVYHHQLNLSEDGTSLLAIRSEDYKKNGRLVRMDTFSVIDLSGKVLKQTTSRKVLNERHKDLLHQTKVPTFSSASREISHFNSFYEIPENTRGKTNEIYKRGNYVLNSANQGVFILDSELRAIDSMLFNFSLGHNVHDVQVNKKGNLVFFNNRAMPFKEDRAFSALQELDPETFNIVFEFTASPKEMFYSQFCGAYQELGDDVVLFSDQLVGTYFYSKSRKEILQSFRNLHRADGLAFPIQQVKGVYGIADFFKNRN